MVLDGTHPFFRSGATVIKMSVDFEDPVGKRATTAAAKLGAWSRCADVIAAFPEGAASLASGTTIITGPTAGIGVATATSLASLGGRVILAARSAEKAAIVAADIIAKHSNAKVTYIHLDLMSLASVSKFVNEFRKLSRTEGWPPLKCIVLNAAVLCFSRTNSVEGYEATFAVSHLAHFLLVTELVPELKQVAPSRIVAVSSLSHFGPYASRDVGSADALREHVVSPRGDDWNMKRTMGAYGNAKLANVMMALSLSQKLAADGVTACSLHPGAIMITSYTDLILHDC